MSWNRYLRRGFWARERARELDSYLEIETDENIARGMAPDQARYAARRKLGNIALVREEIYTMNSLGWLETLAQDLRFGARLLRLNPGFALVALLSLALGVGANTAIFQLLNALRMRSLPVQRPEQLVEVKVASTPHGRTGHFTGSRPQLSFALWQRIRAEQQVFSGTLAWGGGRFNLTDGGEARYARGLWVSGEFFEVLGVPAVVGRVLTADDDRRGCPAGAAVISHAFWQREYGGQRAAVGRRIRLEGQSFEIVGVTPPTFYGVEVGRGFDVAVPLCSEPLINGQASGYDKPETWWLAMLGRLRPGVNDLQATAQLETVSAAIFRETLPATYNALDARSYLRFKLETIPAGTGVSALRASYETPLWLLLSITGLVLLIACANLANLMLARASAREREIAVRLAIGASRLRIVRQLLAESLLLAALGAALGAFLAGVLSRTLVAFLSTERTKLFVDLQPDWHVIGFTAALALLTCVLFGLAPALRATATPPSAAMKASGRSLTDSRERFGLRRALVVVQVALSLVLLVGALLFGRTLRNLMTLDPGFAHQGILTADLDLQRAHWSPEHWPAVYREIVDRLRSHPRVAAAATTTIVPVSGGGWNNRILIDGVVQKDYPNFNAVSPGFFKTMGTPILAGRDFEPRDTPAAPRVAIINQRFARDFYAGRDPLGRTFQIEEPPGSPRPLYQVIGVVRNSKYTDLREPFKPIAFLAEAQQLQSEPFRSLVVRSTVSPLELSRIIRRAAAASSPAIALELRGFDSMIRDSLLRERLMALLSGFFGGLAVLLAIIGLYGVMSYMVERRRGEIGIRIALGASRRAVVRLILRETTLLLFAGLAAGALLAVAAAQTARAMLFGLEPSDPLTLISALALLTAVALAASYLPARRAARLEPTVALREE
jgi:predicted permease